MSLQLLVTLLSTLLLGVMTLPPVRASQSTDDKVFLIHSNIGANWQWSADSTLFTFLDESMIPEGVNADRVTWYAFDVQTQSVTTSPKWPLYPSNFGDPFPSDANQDGFTFVSPSGRYIVYASDHVSDYWRLSVADLSDMTTQYLNAIIGNPYSSSDEFNVFWSDSENTVLVSSLTDTNQPFIQYATGIGSQADIQSSYFFSVEFTDNTLFDIIRILDISRDGSQFLLLTQLVLPPTSPQSLGDQYLVTATRGENEFKFPTEYFIRGNDIRAAAFSPDDESHLLILNAQGLIDLNTATDTINVLEPASTFGNIGRGWFSPNAEWLVFQGDGGLYGYHVLID
ncbi:MAG: hypothetical protein J0M33_15655 [Anaerolineae bacterium]|nr:hypothetical protein [Anaerolineae bacterium]